MSKKRLKLSTPREIRQALSKIANAVYNGELDPQRANSITATANVILSGIRTDEHQRRIDELERLVMDSNGEAVGACEKY